MSLRRFLSTLVLFFVFIFPSNAQDIDELKGEAEKAFMNSQFEESLGFYKQLIDTNDGDSIQRSMYYAYAGLSSEKLNQKKEALNFFKQAILLKVPRLMIYDKMISLAKSEKDNEAYEFALMQKMDAFPDFEGSVVQSLAYLYYNTKAYEKLLNTTDTLTKWYPDNAKFHLFSAVAKQNLGDVFGAKEEYLKVLGIEPDNAGANMGVGMILYNNASNEYDKLKTDYETLESPSRMDYSNFRKNLEKPQNIYKEALPYLLKAYENKSYSSLKGIIRNSYLRIGEAETADKYK